MVEHERHEPRSGPAGSSPSGDLEYDEAHEALAGAAQRTPSHPPVQVATQADDATGGDYAYDLAHDVPRGSGPSASGTR